jgi:hypothetical protein
LLQPELDAVPLELEQALLKSLAHVIHALLHALVPAVTGQPIWHDTTRVGKQMAATGPLSYPRSSCWQ